MRRNRIRLGGVAVLAACMGILLCPARTGAYPILAVDDWNSVEGEGWKKNPPDPQIPEDWFKLTDPNASQWLQVDFAATTDPPTDWYGVAYVEAEDFFAGTWTEDMFVSFNFFADTVVPGAVQLQFQGEGSASYWATYLTPPSQTDQWVSYSAGFSDWNDWFFPGGTQQQFVDDLAAIDWIGIYIYRTGSGAQTYGIDDFTLSVPEPPELVMAGSVLLVSLAGLRSRFFRRRGSAPGPDGDAAPPA